MANEQLSEDERQRLRRLVKEFRSAVFAFFTVDRETDLGRAIRQADVQAGVIDRLTMSDEEGRAAVGHSIGGKMAGTGTAARQDD